MIRVENGYVNPAYVVFVSDAGHVRTTDGARHSCSSHERDKAADGPATVIPAAPGLMVWVGHSPHWFAAQPVVAWHLDNMQRVTPILAVSGKVGTHCEWVLQFGDVYMAAGGDCSDPTPYATLAEAQAAAEDCARPSRE